MSVHISLVSLKSQAVELQFGRFYPYEASEGAIPKARSTPKA